MKHNALLTPIRRRDTVLSAIRRLMESPWLVMALGFLFMPPGQIAASTLEEIDGRLTHTVVLPDLITYAYENSPLVREAREGWRSSLEQYRLETAYPDPELMFSYYPDPIETRLGPQDWNTTLTQKIPFPGKLSKAGEVVEAESRIARLNLDKTVRDLVVSIQESFYELQYIRHAKTVASQNMKLLDHLRKVGETAYAQDRSTLLDMVKAQAQSGQLRYDILLLEDLEKTETARLNSLLNRPPHAVLGKLASDDLNPIVFRLEDIYEAAINHQHEIQMAKIRVEQAGKKIELARLKNLPDFKVGIFYAGIGEPDVSNPPPDEGADALGIQTGISIPLWLGKNKSRILKARAEQKRAEAARTARINETRAMIRSVYFKLTNSKRLMDLYRNELLPQAAKAMEIAETWFREGRSGFSDFVEAQSVWYNFQLALARARSDYGQNRARLERLVGISLSDPFPSNAPDSGKGEK